MKLFKYLTLKTRLSEAGFSQEMDWARDVEPCKDKETFMSEFIFVVVNSGMKNSIAEIILKRIWKAIEEGQDLNKAFGHKGKVKAMYHVVANLDSVFAEYLEVRKKGLEPLIKWFISLPFIGGITCYHLARNLGENCVKPDRHLDRIAKSYKTTPFKLCEELSQKTGDRLGLVDVVLWRSAEQGWI